MANVDILDTLLNLEPHKVSRDMRGYSVLFYGDPKSGKTTTASKFPKSLLLGFEKGWNAIPGIKAIPINTWGELRKVVKALADPRMKEIYETIIWDTSDLAWDYCEKYICSNNGVDTIGQIPYGQGYTLLKKEFDEQIRKVVQLDYGIVLISHATDKTFKDEQGTEFNQIVPTLNATARNVVSRLTDIIGYSRTVTNADGSNTTKLFMRGTPRFLAGSRFKYTPDYIDFSYQNLVDAICTAIDKQAEEDGNDNFISERNNLYAISEQVLDFDEMIDEFNHITEDLLKIEDIEKREKIQSKIIQIIERYLGKGKKVNQMSRDQVEALDLILTDIKELKV